MEAGKADAAAERAKYLTVCQLLTTISTESSNEVQQNAIAQYRPREGSIVAPNHHLNELLDNLAFLLVRRGKGDCIAVAMTGMTRDKIDFIAKLSIASPPPGETDVKRTKAWEIRAAANYRPENLDIDSIDNHARHIFNYMQRVAKSNIRDEKRKVYQEFAEFQIGYSLEKISERFRQLKGFRQKMKGMLLPKEVALIETWRSGMDDGYYIPALPKDESADSDDRVLRNLYQQFSTISSKDGTVPHVLPWDQMMPLAATNFEAWTQIFLWVFENFEDKIQGCQKASSEHRGHHVNLIFKCSEHLATLIKSTIFRNWVEGGTRLLGTIEKSREQEAAKAAPKTEEADKLEISVLPASDNDKGKQKETMGLGTAPAEGTQALTGDHTPHQSKVSKEEPKAKGPFKGTLRKVATGIFGDKVFATLRGRPKARAPLNIPGSSYTESQTQTKFGTTSLAGLARSDPRKGKTTGPLGIGTQPVVEAATKLGELTIEMPEKANRDQDDEEEEDDEVSPHFKHINSTKNREFKQIWLVCQHLFAVDFVLRSPLALRESQRRGFTLRTLPHDTTKSSVYPCEPLKACLGRLLRSDGDEDQQLLKVERFVEDLKRHLYERPKELKALLDLSSENPSVRVSEHAELLLLGRLSKEPRKSGYPYPYIGVSKPPCFVCELVLHQSGFKVDCQTGSSHIYTSKIPDCIAQTESLGAYKIVDETAREVVNKFYAEKRRKSSQDSHYWLGGAAWGEPTFIESGNDPL
ncbi:hypothetical protein Dda_1098 [Drechslerella dactyloides]|uniref:Uncharacterized protein n=1 Tax=Drechslerella dactyloides TaxID=74499 RepID=A0AAD6J7D2_DREDA|nr:hypothetical protein Dda_1098 [Drechslerella dactyloides]